VRPRPPGLVGVPNDVTVRSDDLASARRNLSVVRTLVGALIGTVLIGAVLLGVVVPALASQPPPTPPTPSQLPSEQPLPGQSLSEQPLPEQPPEQGLPVSGTPAQR
jgi:hypothetical protein